MQNSEHIKEHMKKEEQKEKFALWKQWGRALREKDEQTVRRRLSAFVEFLLTLSAAFLMGGTKLFFGTFPLAPVLCLTARKRLPAVLLGLGAACLFGGLPFEYFLVGLSILLIRILAVLMPAIWRSLAEERESEGQELIPYDPLLPVEDGQASPLREKVRGKSAEAPGVLSELFCEGLATRLLCGAVGGFLCGLFLLLERDFSMYALFATLALTLGVPLLTAGLLGSLGEARYRTPLLSVFSLGLLSLFCVMGALNKSILGMPMAPFMAMLLTLYASSEKGIFGGVGIALLCALGFEWRYLPLLLLSAVLFSLVSYIKKSAGVATVCGLVVIFCYYIGGEQGLVYVLPPMLLALPVYMAADRYKEMMRSPLQRQSRLAEGVYFAEAVAEKSKNEQAKDRLVSLSEAFSSLSENFYKLSDRFRRPDILGLKRITDSTFEKICRDCRNRELCYGADYDRTLEAMGHITAVLHKKGNVSRAAVPETFQSVCLRVDRILDEVNKELLLVTEQKIKEGKAGFFASNYEDITAILDAALNSDPEEYACDGEAGEKIFDYLYSVGLNIGGVAVYGKRCRHIVVRKVSGHENIDGEKSRELSEIIGRLVGEELTEPVFAVDKDGVSMLLHAKPKVKAFCSHGRLCGADSRREQESEPILVDPFAAEDENALCGDMTEAFITDSSYFYALISDGMGSGSEAAYTANVSAMFIEKMLMAGNRADVTLRMLNNVIRSENMGCGGECSATVDLLELDLMSGTASFIKSGAAPTYIAREGTVYKISARTMPIGIIKDADARITKFDTRAGDLIIMVSDGCCPDSEDCQWLVEYLCNFMARGRKVLTVGEEICEKIKREILEEAVKNFPEGKERDDISVCVVVVG